MDSKNYAQQILNEPNVFNKINLLNKIQNEILSTQKNVYFDTETLPARDIQVLHPKYHPDKKGFSTPEGQGRMLHDLASIELQAMELGLRTLCEFSESAPEEFKEELLAIVVSESNHLRMCLMEIEQLGFKWGDWPVHLSLWRATSETDSLLDRILIVHRYLEGSGLDAGETLLRRLQLIEAPTVKKAVNQIVTDEVGHVEFGSRWYRKICHEQKIDPNEDYVNRMNQLLSILPKRLEPLSIDLRKQAGFNDIELSYLENLRNTHLQRYK